MSQSPPTSRFQDILSWRPTRNQLLRFAISLFLAILFWGWVTQLQDPYESRTISGNAVQAGSLPDTLQIVTSLPDARVIVSGSRSDVREVRQADLTVTADTSGIASAGTFQVPLLATGANVSSVSVEPREVTIEVDDRISIVLPLTIEKTEASGELVTESEVVPRVSQVTVSGPRRAVERVADVVLPIVIDENSFSYDTSVTPMALDAAGQVISEVEILPDSILAHVEVQRRGKSISVIPNISGIPAEGFTVLQRRALPDTIVVDGPPELLADLLFLNTQPVDITDTTESFSTIVSIEDLPAGVRIIEPADGQVEVRVAIENTTTSSQTIADLPVEVLGLAPGLEATVEPGTISVDVSAPADILQAMTPADITVLVDLTDLTPGTHVIMPEVSLPSGATWSPTASDGLLIRVTIVQGDPEATPASVPVSATPSAGTPAP